MRFIVYFLGFWLAAPVQGLTFGDIKAAVSPVSYDRYVKYFTSSPHLAGSRADLDQAKWIQSEWTKLGLDRVKIYNYTVLLSYSNRTNPNKVSLLDGKGSVLYQSTGFQPPVTPQEVSNATLPNFSAYTPSGTVESNRLVYVYYGRMKDFDYIESVGINVSGAIVLARFGGTFRGQIVNIAQQRGAAGVLYYFDPLDAAPLGKDQVYPRGKYQPAGATEKGVGYFNGGDPLTPGAPAKEYAFQEDLKDFGMPRILVQPISCDDARALFNAMKASNPAPAEWRGSLNVSYQLGPWLKDSNGKVRIVSNNYNQMATVYSVVGIMRGAVEPDRYVISGNHRDAWDFGGVDPASGMSSIMELVRIFSYFRRNKGYKPRRTLMFVSWGAQEYGVLDSTNFVEEFKKIIQERTAVYLNNDCGCFSTELFYPMAVPSMQKVIHNVSALVPNPNAREAAAGRRTVLDSMVYYNPDPANNKTFYLGPFHSDSDHHSFVKKAGVPAAKFDYLTKDFGFDFLTHTLYDTIHYLKNITDPGYKCNLAITQVHAELIRRFADSDILPLDLEDYGLFIRQSAELVRMDYGSRMEANNVTLRYFLQATNNLLTATRSFMNQVRKADIRSFAVQRDINDKLMHFDGYLISEGLTPYSDNFLSSTTGMNTYGGAHFGILTDMVNQVGNKTRSVDPKSWNDIHRLVAKITTLLNEASASLTDTF